MRSFIQDLRYGIRMLVRQPTFTLVVVLTLSLGIGANTAIFSVISGVLIKPLPYEDPDELFVVKSSSEYSARSSWVQGVAYQNFLDWREQNEAFRGLGAYRSRQYRLIDAGEPERIEGAQVTAGFFSTLGVPAHPGRIFSPSDEAPNAAGTVILSHGFWTRRFGADPNAIGRSIVLDKNSYTIIGVMPADFSYPLDISEAEAFTVIRSGDKEHSNRFARVLGAVGRLKQDVDRRQARIQMDALAARLEQQHPKANEKYTLELLELHEFVAGNSRPALLLLQGAAGIVLLIACANCANLFLARNAARARELSVRTALGAGRRRLMRQMLTESLLTGLLGGVLGVVSAYWSADLLIALLPAEVPLRDSITVDRFVLAIALLASVLTGLATGLPAAIRASHMASYAPLKESPQAGVSGSRLRLQEFFVIAQTAMTLVLLIGAGLLIRSFKIVTDVEPGFDPENVLCFRIDLSEAAEPAQRTHALYELQERITGLPGVSSVSACRMAPFGGGSVAGILDILDDQERAPSIALLNPVSENYFKILRIPMLRGRGFTEYDVLGGRGVAVIDEDMSKQYWPDGDAVGKRISLGIKEIDQSPESYEIVGVVGRVRSMGLDTDPLPHVYVPYRQHPHGEMTVAMRTDGAADNLIPAIRRQTAAVINQDAPFSFATMNDAISDSVADRRCPMLLLGAFSTLAIILSTVGVYGMLSYAVAQRTHEIGVRMALGAQRSAIMVMTFRQGAVLTGLGIALGVGVSFVSTRLLADRLYGISAVDAVTFIDVPLLLATVAAAACYIPARRATKVDPMVSLRCE